VKNDLIPLPDAMRALRVQLKAAMAESRGESLQFNLGAIELEFNAVITREASKGGKLSFNLFGAGAEGALGGKFSEMSTQKLKLVLTPFEAPEDGKQGRMGRHRKVSISSTKSRRNLSSRNHRS
jgi:Trypsin-co-occurring domain 2